MRGTSALDRFDVLYLRLIRLYRLLRGLKKDCLGEHGNKDFWAELQKLGRDMSLISAQEAKRVGAISDVSEAAAEKVSPPLSAKLDIR